MAIDRDQILRDQKNRLRAQQEREALVEKLTECIQKGVSQDNAGVRLRGEAPVLLDIVERIILNSSSGRCSRHQYADGRGSLAGCDMNLDDIDAALAVVRKIRGV